MRRRQGELGVKQTRIKPELVGLGVVGLRPCLLPVRTNRVKRVGLRGRAHLDLGGGNSFRAGGRCLTATLLIAVPWSFCAQHGSKRPHLG